MVPKINCGIPQMEAKCDRTSRLNGDSEPELLAEIDRLDLLILHDLFRRSFTDNPPLSDDVGVIADIQSLPDIVVSDQYADAAC